MKLQVGVGSLRELDYYIGRGAAELYCGLYKVPNHVEGARNFTAAAEVGRAAAVARGAGRRLFFAANEVRAELLDETLAVLRELADLGVEGFILKDPALLAGLRGRAKGLEIVLSTLACCLNTPALRYYAGLGVTRLALPEQLTPGEARSLVKNRFGIGAEVFHKARECCVNFNGLCFLDCRGGETNACRRAYRLSGKPFTMPRPSAADHLGELYGFYRLGVGTLKVGRSPDAVDSRLIFDEAAELADLLPSCRDAGEFTARGLKVMETYQRVRGALLAGKGGAWKKR